MPKRTNRVSRRTHRVWLRKIRAPIKIKSAPPPPKTPPPKKGFSLRGTPQILGKERKNAQKSKGNRTTKKARKSKKARIGGSGFKKHLAKCGKIFPHFSRSFPEISLGSPEEILEEAKELSNIPKKARNWQKSDTKNRFSAPFDPSWCHFKDSWGQRVPNRN